MAALHMPTEGPGSIRRGSHLVGAPCGTTALANPDRLMPVLVPAVVPLVPSNKANESSLHGAAFTTNRHYAYRHPVNTTKRAHEQDGSLVAATPAYQSVRPGPITQVLRRTRATLSAAVKRGRILADTEDVAPSRPVRQERGCWALQQDGEKHRVNVAR